LIRTGTGTTGDPYQVSLITTCSANQLLKYSGTSWACATDIDTDTDAQTVSWNSTSNILTISGGNTADLTSLLDNTDSQTVSTSGAGNSRTLTISGGNTIALADNDTLRDLSCISTQVAKWNGTSWACATDIDTDTDAQDLSLTADTLSLVNGGSVDLTPYLDNTDSQALSWNGGTRTLSLANGGSVVIPDADTTYTAGTGITLSGTTFALTNTGVAPGTYNLVTVDAQGRITSANNIAYLTSEQDGVIGNEIADVTSGSGLIRTGTGTTGDPYQVSLITTCSANQLLKYSGTSWACATDIDTDTDAQTVSWNSTSNILTISGGNTADLTSLLDNTDSQTVSTSGAGNSRTLTISGGNTIALADNDTLRDLSCASTQVAKWNGTSWACATDIDTDTDAQDLSLTADTLSLVNGGSVDLTPYLDNTDSQALSWNGGTRTLSLANGGSVVIPDADTTYTAGTGITLSGTTFALTNTGVAPGTYNLVTVDAQGRITSANNIAYLTSEQDGVIGNEIADVTSGSGLIRTGTGTTGDPYQVSLITTCSANQLLKYSGTSWACATDIDTDTDAQTVSWNSTSNILTISGGNTADLTSLLDNTDSQTVSTSWSWKL
jgi:hypothetical protein